MFSRSFLSAEAVGNLGKDVKSIPTKSGKSMATFSIAVTSLAKGADGQYAESTQWIGCTLFGGLADRAVKCLKKGASVLVRGEPKVTQFNKKSGETAAMLEIVVNDFVLLSAKSATAQQTASHSAPHRDEHRQAAPVNHARQAFQAESSEYDRYDRDNGDDDVNEERSAYC